MIEIKQISAHNGKVARVIRPKTDINSKKPEPALVHPARRLSSLRAVAIG
jgi:hypothetical protein